jgi:hypothetical protein
MGASGLENPKPIFLVLGKSLLVGKDNSGLVGFGFDQRDNRSPGEVSVMGDMKPLCVSVDRGLLFQD